MTPVGVFFCWQGGAERDFVNSTILDHIRCAQMTNILGSPMKPHNLFRLCTAVLCQQGRIIGGDFLVIIQIEPLVQIEKRKLV